MILLDATPLQSEHRFRGVGTYTRYLATELAKLVPRRITFAATSRDLHLLPEAIRLYSVSARRSHKPAQVYWMYNEWYLRQMLRRVKPNVFHATDFNGLIIDKSIPTICTLYDVTSFKEGAHHQSMSQRLSDLRWNVYYRRLTQASHVITISESVKRDAVDLMGLPEEKISSIPLGVDVDRFAPSQTKGEKRKQPYLLFMGGRNPNKNVDRILEAFARVNGDTTSLYIGGNWSQEDMTWLHNKTQALGISSHVRHLGFVRDEDLADLLQRATAFLFPSIEEGFGLPVLEAMSARTAVITSNRGALMEVAGNAALLVNPLDVEDIASGIRSLLNAPRLREELIDRGTRRVMEFSWSAVAQKTLAVYEQFS